MRRDADKKFVEYGRKEKDDKLSERGGASASHERAVDVAAHVVGDGLVPHGPVGADAARIPPIAVKFAIAKPHDFGQGVEGGLEEGEEAAEPAEDGDGRQFHDALGNGCEVEGEDGVERVLQQRGGILGGGNPDDDAEAGELCQALEEKTQSDFVGARVDRLIDEGGCPPEVAQVLHVDVLRVGARLVKLRERKGLLGMQVGMAEIAVGEGVRSRLEEDDDGMKLADGADARVVDVVVDVLCGNEEVGECVDAVEEGDNVPDGVEALQSGRVLGRGVFGLLLGDALVGLVGLPGRGKLNQVGNEQVGGDEEEEEQAGDDVGAAVVVASDADEDAVLGGLAWGVEWKRGCVPSANLLPSIANWRRLGV